VEAPIWCIISCASPPRFIGNESGVENTVETEDSEQTKKIMWRALHCIIPLKCILANRHVGDSGSCPLCNQGAEDVLHLLFRCPLARDLWEMLGLDDLVLRQVWFGCA
jgi:hypothetical protein